MSVLLEVVVVEESETGGERGGWSWESAGGC